MKARRVPFDQMKDSEKTHRVEKSLAQSLGKLISSTGSQSNKEVTIITRETCFLYGKPQKKTKTWKQFDFFPENREEVYALKK